LKCFENFNIYVMRRYKLSFLNLLIIATFLVACSNSDSTDLVGDWQKMSSFKGNARSKASSFSIGNKGYIYGGYGYISDNIGSGDFNDLWVYNADGDYWQQRANLGNVADSNRDYARNSAVGFAVDGKGYIGTGYSTDKSANLKDFWEYDPTADTWTQIEDIPVSRQGAVGFGIDGQGGFVTTGYNGSYLGDLYKLNTTTKKWEELIGPTENRLGASAFVINGKAYLVGGRDESATLITEFLVFDPTAETGDTKIPYGKWTKLRKIANVSTDSYDDDYDIVRQYGVAFVINGKGYLTSGTSSGLRGDAWEYDPTTDLWTKKTGLTSTEGSSRNYAVAFSLVDTNSETHGYIATGISGTTSLQDLREFLPNNAKDDND
jgi:N-acetylneuraminic acid mutarotase